MKTQEQVDSFHRFATEQLAGGGTYKSIDELYDQWRYENMSPEESRGNVAALQAAIDDINAGDVGRDAAKIEQELGDELDLPVTE